MRALGVALGVVLLVVGLAAALQPYMVLNIAVYANTAALAPRSHLFFCTHDYEHVDVYAVLAQADVWHALTRRPTCLVMADRRLNRLFAAQCAARGARVSVLLVRGGTVRKVRSALERANVCLFLYREAEGSGAYHMARAWDGPIRALRITSAARRCTDHLALPCVRQTGGRAYRVEYAGAVRNDVCETAPAFMRRLKTLLYPAPASVPALVPASVPAPVPAPRGKE